VPRKPSIDIGERGKLSPYNNLNDLTGKEWIKFTKSWFHHSPKPRKDNEILHPAKYPESLVAEFINFFTQKGDWVFDPFLGTASTLIAAGDNERNGVGIEITKKYLKISKERITAGSYKTELTPLLGSSLSLKKVLEKGGFGEKKFDFVITSPPYWNQLERASMRQKDRKDKGLDTKYSEAKGDIGNIADYNEFVEKQTKIFDQVYDIIKDKGYLVVITNNVFADGRVYPLAFDTAISLTKRGEKSWLLKDEKIWLQNDKPLIALGVNNAWVGNRHHQYCLILRKEKK
jgi:DNA modification methylase